MDDLAARDLLEAASAQLQLVVRLSNCPGPATVDPGRHAPVSVSLNGKSRWQARPVALAAPGGGRPRGSGSVPRGLLPDAAWTQLFTMFQSHDSESLLELYHLYTSLLADIGSAYCFPLRSESEVPEVPITPPVTH